MHGAGMNFSEVFFGCCRIRIRWEKLVRGVRRDCCRCTRVLLMRCEHLFRENHQRWLVALVGISHQSQRLPVKLVHLSQCRAQNADSM